MSPGHAQTPRDQPDHDQQVVWLIDHGFRVGVRDPQINTAAPGAFMVAEPYTAAEVPTEDASRGPWAIGGEDLAALVAEAYGEWRAVVGEPAPRRAAARGIMIHHRQTVCEHCQQVIQNTYPYRAREWTDQAGAAQCQGDQYSGSYHTPVRIMDPDRGDRAKRKGIRS